MQEFSSVTASSYDAESLSPLLNEKAADGWSVVSIVAAGTNIVAYLQRDADEHAGGTAPAAGEDAPSEATPVVETPAEVAPATEEAAATDPFAPAAAVVDEAPAPVNEPAGWASAPEEAATEGAAQVSEPEPAAAREPVVAEPVVAEPVVPGPAAAEAAPGAESAVPAGWYADPSGRFELRYWDGAAWTEHVSRAGQQFTDPPVA